MSRNLAQFNLNPQRCKDEKQSKTGILHAVLVVEKLNKLQKFDGIISNI